jgi:glycosyltransferase involved in cell wall biosynthesis
VVLTGYLDDIRPRVACSSVCVVPMTVGGGTRLKILEAMALGTPVVSTNKGAEGLGVTTEENILIADEPTEFANAILRLLDDPALQAKLAANGQELVREKYGWDQIGEKLDRFLRQVVLEHELQGVA